MEADYHERKEYAEQIARIVFSDKFLGTTMLKARGEIVSVMPAAQSIRMVLPWDYADPRTVGRFFTGLWGMIVVTDEYFVWADRNGSWKGSLRISDIDTILRSRGLSKDTLTVRAHAKDYVFGFIDKEDLKELPSLLGYTGWVES